MTRTLIKSTALAFAASLIIVLMGLQRWGRFPLLWGTLTPITTAAYAMGHYDGRRLLKRNINRISDRLATRETDPLTLSVQLQTLEELGNEISH